MANPALRANRVSDIARASNGEEAMSYAGVLRALAIMFVLGIGAGGVAWHYTKIKVDGTMSAGAGEALLVAILAAFVVGMVLIFKPRLAQGLGIVYALLEGAGIGVISKIYETQSHGIVGEALGVSLGVAGVVWFLYATRIIKVTAKVTRVILYATMGACAFYMISLVSIMLGGPNLDGSGGVVGVGISLVLALVAASTFLTDWAQIDALISEGAEASYNWYGAFSLVLSFVWLYLEVLRILSKIKK